MHTSNPVHTQYVQVRRRIPLSQLLFLAVIVTFFASSCRAQAPAKPVAAIDHAVIISIDGLRPDLLARANTPNIHAMMEQGTFTLWARTVPMAVTLPAHTSMLTGVSVEKHGIDFNTDQHALVYPKVPTIFEFAHNAGMTTAMVAGKAKFASLAKPNTLDWCSIDKDGGDLAAANHAAAVIREHSPQVLFIHFPENDLVGHSRGWGSLDQVRTVENADKYVGMIRQALDEKLLTKSTVVLLSADHGGAGKNHGPDDPRSRHIPWIVVGPGIRSNYDLTQIATLTVNTEDTFATICWLMAIPTQGDIDGKAVQQILRPAD